MECAIKCNDKNNVFNFASNLQFIYKFSLTMCIILCEYVSLAVFIAIKVVFFFTVLFEEYSTCMDIICMLLITVQCFGLRNR